MDSAEREFEEMEKELLGGVSYEKMEGIQLFGSKKEKNSEEEK